MVSNSGPRRKPANRAANLNPAKPLNTPAREIFAQAIANGVPLETAYRQAGYKGARHSRNALRQSLDIDERVRWLLQKRIEDDARNRAKRESKVPALRERVIREWERIAFADVRDLVDWDRKPVYDAEGNLVEIAEELTVRPARTLSRDAAANVAIVRKFGKQVQVETHSKVNALDKLAKVLGLYQDAGPAIVNNATQINIGTAPTAQDNALEAARRLAFAIAKAQQMQALAGPMTIEHAPGAEPKE